MKILLTNDDGYDAENIKILCKELSKNHVCHFYIQANKKIPVEYYKHPAGGVYIDDRMLDLWLPLMKEQKFIHKVEKYNNQEIDINFDIFNCFLLKLN